MKIYICVVCKKEVEPKYATMTTVPWADVKEYVHLPCYKKLTEVE